jgi:hypothetical protein
VNKLSLGPIPKVATVRMAITLPTTLKADLEKYAELHAQTWGEPVGVAGLIPHMLAAFLARDREFKKAVQSAVAGGGNILTSRGLGESVR